MSVSAKHSKNPKQTPRPSSRWPGWCRHARRLTVWILILLIGTYVGLQTPPGKGILTALINHSLEQAGQSIRIRGLSGWLPQTVGLAEITVADEQGLWLRAQGLRLSWQPTSWLKGDIAIEELAAEHIVIVRRPVRASGPAGAPDMDTLPGVTVGQYRVSHLQLESALLGSAYDLSILGNCQLAPQLEAFAGQIRVTGDLDHGAQWSLQSHASPARGQLHVTLDTPQGTGHLQSRYALSSDGLDVSDVNITVPGAGVQGHLKVQWASGLAQGQLQIQVEDAAHPAHWFGQRIQGQAQARVQLQVTENTQQVIATWTLTQIAWTEFVLERAQGRLELLDPMADARGEVTLALEGLTRGDQQIDQLTMNLKGAPQRGQWDLQSHGNLKHPFRLDTRGAWQSASPGWAVSLDQTRADYGPQRVEVQPGAKLLVKGTSGTLHDWNLLINERALHLEGEVTLDPANARTTGAVQMQGAVTADVTWDATIPLTGSRGEATAVVTRNGIPLTGSLGYQRSDQILALSPIRVTAPGLELQGQAHLDITSALLQGHLQADIPDACAVTTFLGFPVQTQAQARLDFTTEGNLQQASGTWTLDHVMWHDLQLQSHRGSLSFEGPWTQPTAKIALQGTALSWKQMQWDHWQVSLEGNHQRLDLSVLGAGQLNRPMAVDAQARIQWDGSDEVLALQHGLIHYGAMTFTLNRPARILRTLQEADSAPRYELENWQWQADEATLSLQGWGSRDQLAIQATVADLPARHLPLSSTEALSGHIHAQFQMSGSPQQPCLELDAQAMDVAFLDSAEDDVTHLHGSLATRLGSDALTAAVTVFTPDRDEVQAELHLPLQFSLWPPRWTQPNSDLHVTLGADTDVRILDWLPVLREAVMAGRVTADLTYHRTHGQGTVQGQARWINGRYEDILLGTVVQDIQARLRAQGDTLVLEDVVASAGDSGQLTLGGQLRLAPGLPYEIQVKTDRFPWIQRADVVTVASGQAHLSGTLRTVALAGKLTLDQGLLDLGALAPAPPPVLTSTRPMPTEETAAPQKIAVQGNLELDLRGGFRIYGAGLDSIWDGQLTLIKTGNHWNVTGSVSPRRGEFRLLGKPFRLTEGSIKLDGSWPMVPILDLTAVYRRSGIEARVHISGRANNPLVRIDSDPPLPEDAILATVLFGRDLATVTALQALQLAAAVQSLNSPGGGMDVFQRTRLAVGVDTIDIRQSEDQTDSSTVAIGKYLAPEVYVEVQQPLSRGGVASTHIEYEIFPNLTVETDAGPGIRPGVGINWKKDY